MNIEQYVGSTDKDLLNLLLLADPDEGEVEHYVSNSEVWVARADNKLLGVAVLMPIQEGFELKNIAVDPSHQGRGIAKKLIKFIQNRVKELGGTSLLVGTGNSSLNQLALYQKTGFRVVGVQANYFASYSPPIYENGIRCLDLIKLKIHF